MYTSIIGLGEAVAKSFFSLFFIVMTGCISIVITVLKI